MANIDEIHRSIANRRAAFVYFMGRYSKKTQVQTGSVNASNIWKPKEGIAPTPAKTAFRHIRKRGYDRRIGIFRFRITRDDGTVIDPTLMPANSIGIGIKIRQWDPVEEIAKTMGGAHGYDLVGEPEDATHWTFEENIWRYFNDNSGRIIEFSYNTETQVWTVPFSQLWSDERPKHGRNFRAYFYVDDSVWCEYIKSSKEYPEYVYKTADMEQEESLIRPRLYEVRVPYYKETFVRNTVPSPDFPDGDYYGLCGRQTRVTQGWCNASKNQSIVLIIASSIQYTIGFKTESLPTAVYHGTYNPDCTYETCDDCEDLAEEDWYFRDYFDPEGSNFTPGGDFLTFIEGGILTDIRIPAWVKVTSSNADISTNIYINPIDSETVITPVEPYAVSTQEHRMDAFYTGDDPYELHRDCDSGTVYFPLDFEIFRLKYNIEAAPKID